MAEQIPFTRGVPSSDLLPIAELRASAATAFETDAVTALSYTPNGHPGLRAWIGEPHGVPLEQVICANGSLELFSFVCAVLLEQASTRRVIVEAPTYDRSLLLLRRLGAEIVGVPVDGDGMVVDALEEALADGVPALVYTIPNFQNPSGSTLSDARRRALCALAVDHGFTIIEDDPYGLLRWAGASRASLFSLAPGHVVTMSSFTKTVAPGLRVGYAVAAPALAKAIGAYATNTYIAPSMLAQSTLAAYCAAGHFEPGVARATAALHERCDAMVEAVREHFPATASFVVPEGGYFLWIDLGEGSDTSALAVRAQEAGVPFVRGRDFYVDGAGTTELRLAFSAVAPAQIRAGIERLGALTQSLTG